MLVADETRRLGIEPLGKRFTSLAVDLLHPDHDHEHVAVAGEVANALRDRVEVGLVLGVRFLGAVVEVERPVVLALVLTDQGQRGTLGDVGLDRPPKWVDRADDEDLLLAVPAGLAQKVGADRERGGLERPRGVGASGGPHAQAPEHIAGGVVSALDQCVLAVLLDEVAQ